MKPIRAAIVICIAFGLVVAVHGGEGSKDPADLGLIPAPAIIQVTGPGMTLDKDFALTVTPRDATASKAARQIARMLGEITGTAPTVRTVTSADIASGTLLLTTDRVSPVCREEGYALTIAPGGGVLRANSARGFFYGSQTLRQLLTRNAKLPNTLPGVHIIDTPRYAWRGMHLDVGRHFMPQGLRQALHRPARHAQVQHLPLAPHRGSGLAHRDQEIPQADRGRRLAHRRRTASVTAASTPRTRSATSSPTPAQRHITVVPEIEMPGHTQAGTGRLSRAILHRRTVRGRTTTWGVYKDVYCAGNDETFEFLENVLTEVAGSSRQLPAHRRRRVPQGPLEGLRQVPGPHQDRGAGRRARVAELLHQAHRQGSGQASTSG
jgi:hexosaminidase